LASAAEKVESSFQEQPEIGAAVRSNIGYTYLSLGRFDDAKSLLESALKMQEALHGGEHLEVAETLTRVGALYFEQGNYERSEASMREAIDIRRRLLGEDHLLVAQGLDTRNHHHRRGDFAEAKLKEGSVRSARATGETTHRQSREQPYSNALSTEEVRRGGETLRRRRFEPATADLIAADAHSNLATLCRM
jgi:tetratricopeptide (TPR) repeat protein